MGCYFNYATTEMKNLLITIALILLAFFLTSCGARKSKSGTTKTEIKKDLVVDIENNVTKTVIIDSTSNEVKEVITYTPVDNTQPSKVNDIVFVNTTIKKEKSILKTAKNVKSEVVDKTSTNLAQKETTSTKSKDKSTDRKQFNPLVLLWLLLPIGLYIFIKKYIRIL